MRSVREDADNAGNWVEFRQAADGLDLILGSGAVGRIRQAVDDATAVPGIVKRRLFGKWLDAVYVKDSRLIGFAARDHEGVRRKFSELDRSLPATLREEIREKLFGRYPRGAGAMSRGGQLGDLRGELTKKRRQMSVRRLLARCPNVIQALKPCFLMSPLAVSQYLERTGRGQRGHPVRRRHLRRGVAGETRGCRSGDISRQSNDRSGRSKAASADCVLRTPIRG